MSWVCMPEGHALDEVRWSVVPDRVAFGGLQFETFMRTCGGVSTKQMAGPL